MQRTAAVARGAHGAVDLQAEDRADDGRPHAGRGEAEVGRAEHVRVGAEERVGPEVGRGSRRVDVRVRGRRELARQRCRHRDVHLRAALEPRGVGCDGADPVRPDGQRARERAAGAEHAVEVGRPDELSGEHAFLEVTGRPGEGDGLPGREQTAIDRSADGDERRRVARGRSPDRHRDGCATRRAGAVGDAGDERVDPGRKRRRDERPGAEVALKARRPADEGGQIAVGRLGRRRLQRHRIAEEENGAIGGIQDGDRRRGRCGDRQHERRLLTARRCRRHERDRVGRGAVDGEVIDPVARDRAAHIEVGDRAERHRSHRREGGTVDGGPAVPGERRLVPVVTAEQMDAARGHGARSADLEAQPRLPDGPAVHAAHGEAKVGRARGNGIGPQPGVRVEVDGRARAVDVRVGDRREDERLRRRRLRGARTRQERHDDKSNDGARDAHPSAMVATRMPGQKATAGS